jgi:scyllo-inositol 2-dehydrogenase (NADP+)
LTVFQNRRWDGDLLTVRRLLAEGRLGTVTRFESRFERWRPQPKPGWRESGAAGEGGGVLADLGSHLVDQALLLFGPVVSVYAETDRRRPGVEVDDDAFVALRHAGGARSHLWMSAVAAQLGPRLRVLGTAAGYVKYGLDIQEAALRAGADPAEPGWGCEDERSWGTVGVDGSTVTQPTEAGAYPTFYRAVATALREGTPMPVDPAEAVTALQVLDAARTSAAEGVVVPFEAAG